MREQQAWRTWFNPTRLLAKPKVGDEADAPTLDHVTTEIDAQAQFMQLFDNLLD